MAIPAGKPDWKASNITHIGIVDNSSETIRADFIRSKESGDSTNVICTTNPKPNDTFLSCGSVRMAPHLVQCPGIFEHEGTTYAEFWALHPYVPPELLPYEEPKVFECSLCIDFSIMLSKYEEFRFD